MGKKKPPAKVKSWVDEFGKDDEDCFVDPDFDDPEKDYETLTKKRLDRYDEDVITG